MKPNRVELRLKQATLDEYGLPDIGYPVPANALESILFDGDELPLALMLRGLQEYSGEEDAPWRSLEPALDRLADLLAPKDRGEILSAASERWWLEVGPVDLNAKLVTIQRGDDLVAAITPREDGRLRVATFRPLDGKSAEYLIGLSLVPHPDGGVCMRENNWEYALDCSAGIGNYYAADRGEAYLSYWEKGLGLSSDDSEVPVWRKQVGLVARPAARVIAELGVYFTVSLDAYVAPADETVPAPSWSSKRQQRRTVQGRFLGCLLGGAVGDALGAPVEFMARTQILDRFGPQGITEYAPQYGGLGRITDDTQMTLFTAEGLLRAWVRGCFKGITTYSGVTAHAYLRWLQTQGERSRHDLTFGDEPGWLFQQADLHHQRAPGTTCLSALRDMRSLGAPAENDRKGCGGVMRVAPVGLFSWCLRSEQTPEDAFRLGAELAGLTHGHPTGQLPAGVLAVLILALTDGASLQEGLHTAKALLRKQPQHQETLRAIEEAEMLALSGLPHPEAIARLGQGWIAEEALAIALYCALVARSFRQGVILAVNHDGDSDSTGSIVGNLLGTQYGVKRIPHTWLEALELREVITELADDLYAFKDWELNERIWRKYPGY